MNKNENYIMLGGKKIPLTDEQVKLIKADVPEKSPFDRADNKETYYYFICNFDVRRSFDQGTISDDLYYNSSNYCTDKDIMTQHALHMKLNNLLWRYSMTHGGDSIDWNNRNKTKVVIYYNAALDKFGCSRCVGFKYFGDVPFTDEETAEAAIEEIVKPFIEEHPDFDVTKM